MVAVAVAVGVGVGASVAVVVAVAVGVGLPVEVAPWRAVRAVVQVQAPVLVQMQVVVPLAPAPAAVTVPLGRSGSSTVMVWGLAPAAVAVAAVAAVAVAVVPVGPPVAVAVGGAASWRCCGGARSRRRRRVARLPVPWTRWQPCCTSTVEGTARHHWHATGSQGLQCHCAAQCHCQQCQCHSATVTHCQPGTGGSGSEAANQHVAAQHCTVALYVVIHAVTAAAASLAGRLHVALRLQLQAATAWLSASTARSVPAGPRPAPPRGTASGTGARTRRTASRSHWWHAACTAPVPPATTATATVWHAR